jgi:hypothetical protein
VVELIEQDIPKLERLIDQQKQHIQTLIATKKQIQLYID